MQLFEKASCQTADEQAQKPNRQGYCRNDDKQGGQQKQLIHSTLPLRLRKITVQENIIPAVRLEHYDE